MAYDETLAEKIREVLSESRGITEKKMFGGLCFLLHGNMLCGVDNKSRMMIRVGPEKYDDSLKLKHARPMTFTGRAMRGMLYINPEGTTRLDSVRKWVDLAKNFVSTLPKK
jgi:hypothetical protein